MFYVIITLVNILQYLNERNGSMQKFSEQFKKIDYCEGKVILEHILFDKQIHYCDENDWLCRTDLLCGHRPVWAMSA